MSRLMSAAAAALLVGTFGCGEDEVENIDETRAAVSVYTDVGMALADGYVSTHEYVESPEGGMGIHFLNPDITGIDYLRPNVLLYDLNDRGEYSLIGAEWLAPAAMYDEAPELFGQTFEGPMPGHEEGQPEHYELHAWLFTENPDGMFHAFNPNVQPPMYIDDVAMARSSAMGNFSDYMAALDSGYVNTMECASSADGGMGVHFIKEDMSGPLDPEAPHILLYEPHGDGYDLIGVEWFVPSAMVTEVPMLFGQRFDGPMPGHEEGQPEHYDLHVWAVRTNPRGMFEAFNPRVTCP